MARILVVEDDKYLNKLITDRLSIEGFSVESALDGAQAYEMLEAKQSSPEKFDIVICDMLLPKLMGAELFAKIQDASFEHPRLIAMSGIYKTSPEIESLCQLYQIERYWTKPFDIEELVHSLAGKEPPKTRDLPRGQMIDTSFEKLLLLAYTHAFTGKLTIKKDSLERRIFFLNGFPVSANSTAVSESLGRSLLLLGLIDESTLQRAGELMVTEKLQFGQMLIKMQALKKEQLFEGLRKHVFRLLLNTVRIKDGDYAFETLKELPSHILALEFNWVILLLKAYQGLYNADFLKSLFEAKQDFFIRSSERAMQIFPLLNLDAASLNFFQSLPPHETLKNIIRRVPEPNHEMVYRVLFLLENLGLVEFLTEPSKNSFVQTPSADFTKVFESEKNVNAQSLKTLQAEYMDLLNKDHFEILEVTPETSDEDLDEAYRATRYRLHPDRFGDEISGQTKRILDDMLARIDRAYQTLKDPTSKSEYIESQNKWKQDSVAESKRFLDAQDLFREGLTHLANQNLESALENFKKAHVAWDRGIEYRLYAIFTEWKLCQQKGRTAEADACLQKLKQEAYQNPSSDIGFLLLGHAYLQISKIDLAKEAYQLALKSNDKNDEAANALAHLGSAQMKKMKMTGAIQKSKRGFRNLVIILGLGILMVLVYQQRMKWLQEEPGIKPLDAKTIENIFPALSFRQKSEVAKIVLKEDWIRDVPDPVLKGKCSELLNSVRTYGIVEVYLFDSKQGLKAVCRPEGMKRYLTK